MRKENFIYDLYSERFDTSDKMLDALKDLAEDTTWERAKANSIIVSPLDNFPMLAGEIAKERGCDENAIRDTMSGTKLTVTLFNGVTYPLRDTAIKSLLERAEVTGGVIRKLSPEELSQLFAICMPKAKGDALILIRGKKASAILSDNGGGYEYLPMNELMNLTEEMLSERFRDKGKFVVGEIRHDFMLAKYIINEPALLKEYEVLTKECVYGGEYMPQLSIYSSDVGTCSATVAASLRTARGATIRINGELAIAHKKGATLEHFGEKLQQTFAKYVEFTTRLGEMAKIKISNPCKAFMLAQEKAGLPKKLTKKALEDFNMYVGDDLSNAHDIYLGLCETLFYAKCAGYSEKDLCRLEDLLARCLTFNWEEWEEWEN